MKSINKIAMPPIVAKGTDKIRKKINMSDSDKICLKFLINFFFFRLLVQFELSTLISSMLWEVVINFLGLFEQLIINNPRK